MLRMQKAAGCVCCEMLNMLEDLALKRIEEELIFVCGNTLFPEGPYEKILVVREQLNCESTIKVTYFAGLDGTSHNS